MDVITLSYSLMPILFVTRWRTRSGLLLNTLKTQLLVISRLRAHWPSVHLSGRGSKFFACISTNRTPLLEILDPPLSTTYWKFTGVKTSRAGGGGGQFPPRLKKRGAVPWFSYYYTSQEVGLTLWFVLALHRSLYCSLSVAAVVE